MDQTPPKRSVAHGVFTIERHQASATPQRVFDAFASLDGKSHWFTLPAERAEIMERGWISGSAARNA